jgi:hypothetical protein
MIPILPLESLKRTEKPRFLSVTLLKYVVEGTAFPSNVEDRSADPDPKITTGLPVGMAFKQFWDLSG